MWLRVLPSCMTVPEAAVLIAAMDELLSQGFLPHMKAGCFPSKPNSPLWLWVHRRWDISPLVWQVLDSPQQIQFIFSFFFAFTHIHHQRATCCLPKTFAVFSASFFLGRHGRRWQLEQTRTHAYEKAHSGSSIMPFLPLGNVWALEWRRLYESGNVNTLHVLKEHTGGAARLWSSRSAQVLEFGSCLVSLPY